MSSLVIYGNEFEGHIENGLAPESFKYRFLVEGDSWMDRSAMFHTSLLQKLAPEMDAHHESCLFINIAMFGDTMRRIGNINNVDLAQWLETQFAWKFDAVLLSAGGNDYIDAARDPAPGKGILEDCGAGGPATGAQCLRAAGLTALVNQWLNPGFASLYAGIQASRHRDVPIFLNSYDTPVARNAPVFRGGRTWLRTSYINNNIPEALWPSLTGALFAHIQATISGWAVGRSNVHIVPTTSVLKPALPGSTGESGDWLNEIHPNAAGWEKLAPVWRDCIKTILTP